MSDAAPDTEPDAKPSRSGLLLCLIRRLIDYGRELASTIRQRAATDPRHTRFCFGTTDLAQILTSIARGLVLANALEARVLQRAALLDKAPRPRKDRPRPTPRPCPRAEPAAPPPAEPADPAPGLDPALTLPTPEQIAAEIRRRPIGAVLADICRGLGIHPGHPLWRDVQQAIRRHGGSVARLLTDMFDRYCPLPPRSSPDGLPGPALAPAGTGPP